MRARRVSRGVAFAIMSAVSAPAMAQDDPAARGPSAFTVSGSATLVSDYRFRGVSQSDGDLAIQGSLNVDHESGFYAGAFASSLDGYGSVGGADVELDLYGGYRRTVGAATLDGGLLYYLYPGGPDDTDFAELYANVSSTLGPGTVKLGAAYAPRQRALANVSAAPNSRGQRQDNLYLFADASAAVVGTPVTVRAHIGRSDGNSGLGPNNTSLSPTGRYWDYSIGADAVLLGVTFGLAYVDTDIGRRESLRLQPFLSEGRDGTGSIVDGKVVLSVTASF